MIGNIIALLLAGGAVLWAIFYGSKAVDRSRVKSVLKDKAPDVIQWRNDVNDAAAYYGLNPDIIQAIIWQESEGDPNAIGASDEVGLMQLKPGAVDDVRIFLGDDYSNYKQDPRDNIFAGAGYLKVNLKPGRADENLHLALRMYNQGVNGAYLYPDKSIKYADAVLQKAKLLGF